MPQPQRTWHRHQPAIKKTSANHTAVAIKSRSRNTAEAARVTQQPIYTKNDPQSQPFSFAHSEPPLRQQSLFYLRRHTAETHIKRGHSVPTRVPAMAKTTTRINKQKKQKNNQLATSGGGNVGSMVDGAAVV